MHEEMTDEALMCAYQAGDIGAFEVLFQRHRAPLYRFLLRQCPAGVAEELSQDCWSSLIRARRTYAVSAKFTTWLFRIAHNRLIDHFRSSERSMLAGYDDAETLERTLEAAQDQPRLRPDAQFETQELARRLMHAIDALPPPQREAFLMQQEGDMTVDEIAAATGVGRETAKSRLRYALATLRKKLGMLHEETT